MADSGIVTQKVNVTFMRHASTGLWSAESEDLHGFMIFGRSYEDLMGQIADSLRALIEADGRKVVHVEQLDAEPVNDAWSLPAQRQVDISYAA